MVVGILLAIVVVCVLPTYITKALHRYFDTSSTISDDVWITGVLTLEAICTGVCFYCLSPSLY